MASSSSLKLSRFDLLGFTLPLNFELHKAYRERSYNVASSAMKEVEVLASMEEIDLFPLALQPTNTESQYELLSRNYQSLTFNKVTSYNATRIHNNLNNKLYYIKGPGNLQGQLKLQRYPGRV